MKNIKEEKIKIYNFLTNVSFAGIIVTDSGSYGDSVKAGYTLIYDTTDGKLQQRYPCDQGQIQDSVN